MFPRIRTVLPAVLVLALLCAGARAEEENAGQADLDKATEAKLSAQSLTDLAEVIRLCQSSLKAGLNETNKEFATKLLAGALVQRAEALCGQIFDQPVPPARWQQLRRAALADLEKVVELDPDEADVHYLIGRLNALPGGDRKRAIAALDEAVRLSKKEPASKAKALVLRADLVDDAARRQADLNEAVELAPRNPEVLQARGLFYLTQEKYKEAVADLDASLLLEADNPKVHEARGIAQFLLKNFDEALRSFDKVVELAPDSVMAYTQRARVKLVQGDAAAALADLDKALEIDGRSVAVLLLRASVLQQLGKTEKAIEDVERSLRLQPGLTEAVEMHAILAASKGKYSAAIDDLEKLKRQSPDDVRLLMELGMCYNADKQPQKAVEIFSTLIKENPKTWKAYRGRADAYLSLARQSDAIADYEAALSLEPGESGILNNLAWVLATAPEDSLRNGKRSLDLATKACEATKYKQSHILSTLAAAYAETGDFDHAIEWSKKSVELGSERLKPQLAQELESYQNHKPWREARPDDNAAAVDEPAAEEDDDEVDSHAQAGKDKAAADDGDDAGPTIKSAGNADAQQAPQAAPGDEDDDDRQADDSDTENAAPHQSLD